MLHLFVAKYKSILCTGFCVYVCVCVVRMEDARKGLKEKSISILNGCFILKVIVRVKNHHTINHASDSICFCMIYSIFKSSLNLLQVFYR